MILTLSISINVVALKYKNNFNNDLIELSNILEKDDINKLKIDWVNIKCSKDYDLLEKKIEEFKKRNGKILLK